MKEEIFEEDLKNIKVKIYVNINNQKLNLAKSEEFDVFAKLANTWNTNQFNQFIDCLKNCLSSIIEEK